MGTTWLFNVLRALAHTAGTPLGTVADGAPLPPSSWRGPVVIKSHRADAPDLLEKYRSEIPICAFVMLRNAESTFASLVRTQQESPQTLLSWLDRDLRTYEESLPHVQNVVTIREEWIEARGRQIVSKVSSLLGWEISLEDANTISSEFSKDSVRRTVRRLERQNGWEGGFTNFDRDSQWHAGHISDGDYEIGTLDSQTRATLEHLQVRIDALTEDHIIWEQKTFSTQETECSAMDYVHERQARSRSHQSALTRLRLHIGARFRRWTA